MDLERMLKKGDVVRLYIGGLDNFSGTVREVGRTTITLTPHDGRSESFIVCSRDVCAVEMLVKETSE